MEEQLLYKLHGSAVGGLLGRKKSFLTSRIKVHSSNSTWDLSRHNEIGAVGGGNRPD